MPFQSTDATVSIADSAFPAVSGPGPGAELANAVIRLAVALNAPRLVATVATIGAVSPDLTPGEREMYRHLDSPERQRSWLAGRAAIKAARRSLGQSTDTAALWFPNACTSLTHAAGHAIAVAVPDGALTGIGIDFEPLRETSPGIARFYLTDVEQHWVESRAIERQNDDRIRLWTVKEAAYKACPDNDGLNLGRLKLDDPARLAGQAAAISAAECRAPCENAISYASSRTSAGWVSLALVPDRNRPASGARKFCRGNEA